MQGLKAAPLVALSLMLQAPSPALATNLANPEMGSPAHQARAALLAELLSGPLAAMAIPTAACSNAVSGARTVSRDLAFYLTALSRDGRISASCEPTEPGQEACRVTVSQSIPGTEIRWSRFYNFVRSTNWQVDGGTLACLTVP